MRPIARLAAGVDVGEARALQLEDELVDESGREQLGDRLPLVGLAGCGERGVGDEAFVVGGEFVVVAECGDGGGDEEVDAVAVDRHRVPFVIGAAVRVIDEEGGTRLELLGNVRFTTGSDHRPARGGGARQPGALVHDIRGAAASAARYVFGVHGVGYWFGSSTMVMAVVVVCASSGMSLLMSRVA